MRTYTFFYLDSYDSMLYRDYKEYVVSGSTFAVASSRFFNFFRNIQSGYIGYASTYKIVSSSGKITYRSFKELDLRCLSKICEAHRYCYSDSKEGNNND